MAASTAAQRLTEAHRLAQARLGAATVQQMLAIWPLLDPAHVDATMANWLRAATPIVQAQRDRSARLAANYLTTFRTLEVGVAGNPTILLAGPADPVAVTTSLTVTGPWRIKGAQQAARAAETAKSETARAAMRHSLNGGRETILRTMAADADALGWARVTSRTPCSFCAMLAGRGPVYRSQHSADFHAHDGCHCTAEPVYSTGAAWPPGAKHFHDLWQQSTHGLAGDQAEHAFRTALTAA